jgi:hypothetical protein
LLDAAERKRDRTITPDSAIGMLEGSRSPADMSKVKEKRETKRRREYMRDFY